MKLSINLAPSNDLVLNVLMISNRKPVHSMKFPKRSPSTPQKSQWPIILATLLFTIYSDQYTKSIAKSYLAGQEPIPVNSGIIVFSYVENNAGFLGILKGVPEYIQFFLLNICVSLILLYCLYYLFFRDNHTILRALALSILTGGGISNLVDRILYDGRVIDFLQVGIGPVKTGIFNLADLYILTGSFLIGFLVLSADA